MAPWHHVGATMEITLDKNGSLYDPAGTESWNMQIRSEKLKLTMQVRLHGSRGVSSVATDPPGTPVAPCIAIRVRKGEDKGRKKREVLHLFRCYTHTHGVMLGG